MNNIFNVRFKQQKCSNKYKNLTFLMRVYKNLWKKYNYLK